MCLLTLVSIFTGHMKMAESTKYKIAYKYFKLDDKGRPKSKSSTHAIVTAPSDLAAMEAIRSRHIGFEVQFDTISKV